MIVYLIIMALVVAYGVWYAVDPMRVLRRKYGHEEVPKTAIQTARISGVVIAVLGLVCFIYLLVQTVSGS